MSVAVIRVAPSITWLLVMTSPAEVTTMPVPAPSPMLAVVVLMSTSPGLTCAAREPVVPDAAAAFPDGAALNEPFWDGVSPGSARLNGRPERPNAEGDAELGGQRRCATAPPASAASATTTSPASTGRRHRLRGGSPIGDGGGCSGSALIDSGARDEQRPRCGRSGRDRRRFEIADRGSHGDRAKSSAQTLGGPQRRLCFS